MEQIVLFRLLQGACGAAVVPLSQATMLDNYTAQERPRILAIWGSTVVLGPIMGPTIGGWLTDNYGWHWVFLINVPIGIVTVFGLLAFMAETAPRPHLKFDWFGFGALSIGLGALQLMLDRGEQLGWFTSTEIVIELIISIAGFYFFIAHALTSPSTFIRFELFKDRNFLGGCVTMVIFGAAMLGTLALASPFVQHVLGYPAMSAGYILASRGVGTLISMMFVSRLLRRFEARYLMQVGFVLLATSLYMMSRFTDMTSESTVIVTSLLQGFSMGLVFVPRNVIAFATLPAHLRNDGTAIMTLSRNIGGSIGISILIANLSSGITLSYAQLAELLTPFNNALTMPDVRAIVDLSTDAGRAFAETILLQQAQVIAYANDFLLLMVYVLCAVPLTLMLDSSRKFMTRGAPPAPDAGGAPAIEP